MREHGEDVTFSMSFKNTPLWVEEFGGILQSLFKKHYSRAKLYHPILCSSHPSLTANHGRHLLKWGKKNLDDTRWNFVGDAYTIVSTQNPSNPTLYIYTPMVFACNEAFGNCGIYFPMNATGHVTENWYGFFLLLRGICRFSINMRIAVHFLQFEMK